MLRFFTLLTAIVLLSLPATVKADEGDDFDLDTDQGSAAKKRPANKTKGEASGGDDLDEQKDDLDLEADRVTKAKQVNEAEAPVSTDFYDNDKKVIRRKTTYFGIELLGGARGGLLDLKGYNGLGVDLSPVLKLGKNFALALNINVGALLNSDMDFLQTLAIHLEPRIYIPIRTKSKDPVDPNKGTIEAFVSIKGGYFTQNIIIEETRKRLSGVGLGMGFGVDYFINRIIKTTFQFTYFLPHWLTECDDYSGQHHCSNTKITGHLWSVTAGVGLIF